MNIFFCRWSLVVKLYIVHLYIVHTSYIVPSYIRRHFLTPEYSSTVLVEIVVEVLVLSAD